MPRGPGAATGSVSGANAGILKHAGEDGTPDYYFRESWCGATIFLKPHRAETLGSKELGAGYWVAGAARDKGGRQ